MYKRNDDDKLHHEGVLRYGSCKKHRQNFMKGNLTCASDVRQAPVKHFHSLKWLVVHWVDKVRNRGVREITLIQGKVIYY